jgi:hypothetical protein
MRVARLVAVGGALGLAWACLYVFAPGYWTGLGFPLDDSWIHAVYGRELARSGMLAYNPGIPAAGATSPLWALVFALPHLLTRDPASVALLMKIIGFALHGVTAWLALRLAERVRIGSELTGGDTSHAGGEDDARGTHGRGLAAIVAAMLVALHPDLLAASVSGMEVPLATALGVWVAIEVLRGPSTRLAVACFLAPLGRPEIACIGFVFVGFLFIARVVPFRPLLRIALVVASSTAISMAAVVLRTWLATGRPLPSTFYGKVVDRGLSPWFVQWFGYRYLLEHFALVNSLFLLVPLVVFAAWLLLRPRLGRQTATAAAATAGASATDTSTAAALTPGATASAILLTGTAFFSISFALVAPLGHTSFYFQRYALPGLPFVLIGLPLLIEVALRALPTPRTTWIRGAIVAALAVGLLAPLPARLHRLANDARNIDDVQVAEGKALAQAAPTQVVWAVDAGAIRYFGNAFVIDTLGLNTPEMLTADRARYLAQHRPHYFSIVGGGWSGLDEDSMRRMEVTVFRPTTPYTVIDYLPQAVHNLKRCPAEPHRGRYAVFGVVNEFECGTW